MFCNTLKKKIQERNVKITYMKKRLARKIAGAALLVSLGLTGCGQESGVNIDEGMAFIENLDYEGALQSFEKAIVNSEDLELAYRGQGIAYMGLTDYENAIAAFEKALSNADMFPGEMEYDINYYLATAKYKNNDFAGAVEVLNHIIDLRKKDEQALFLRGSAKVLNGDYEEGKVDLEQSISLSQKASERVIEVYKVVKEAGHEEEGRVYLNDLLNDPKTTLSDYEKGRLYYYLEDYENARNSLEQARTSKKEKNYKESDIVLMLGQTYEKLGDVNYAATLYEDYLAGNEENDAIYNQLGLCRMGAENYEAALDAFEKALAMPQTNYLQTLKWNQIVCHEYLGDFTKAKVLAESYLKEYPDDEKAIREYEFLKTR